jgi:ABC-type uncharacterized transport system permease subunit
VEILLNPQLWSSTLTLAVPLGFAALGGVFSERAGVVNVALEGMMAIAAFVAVAFSALTNNPWLGLLAAMVTGALVAALFAWAVVYLRSDHIVTGLAVNILASGTAAFLFNVIYGPQGTPSNTPMMPTWTLPGIDRIPFIGGVLGHHQALDYLFFPVLIISAWVLFRTPLGLRWRAVGESPRAADAAGVPVLRVKFWAVVAAGVVCGLGGADLSIGILNSYSPGMVAGRGFIALAAVIFGNWLPYRSFLAALLFGFATALAFQLESSLTIAKNLILMLPYLATIVALTGFVGRTRPPAADGEPYDPGR